MMMIDCHTHVGTHHTFSETPDEMIQSLRSSGLSGMLSCPMSGTMAADEKELIAGNEEALVLHEKHPDFLYPGTALHPLYPEKASIIWKNSVNADFSGPAKTSPITAKYHLMMNAG